MPPLVEVVVEAVAVVATEEAVNPALLRARPEEKKDGHYSSRKFSPECDT